MLNAESFAFGTCQRMTEQTFGTRKKDQRADTPSTPKFHKTALRSTRLSASLFGWVKTSPVIEVIDRFPSNQDMF